MTRDFQQTPVISYRLHPHFTCLHKKEQVLSSADKSAKLLFFPQLHLSPFDIWYSAIRISLAFAEGPILGVVFVIKGNSAIKLEGFILRRSYCLILGLYEKGSIKERKCESKQDHQ